MKCRAIPYEGTEPFIFFSYCHADEAKVYPVIEYLASKGCRIWYDNGIHVGDDWPETIAKKLTESHVFVAAVTHAYCNSHNCKNELTFEVEDKKDIVAVIMEDFFLPLGVRLQLATTQQLRVGTKSVQEWTKSLLENSKIRACVGAPITLVGNDVQDGPDGEGTQVTNNTLVSKTTLVISLTSGDMKQLNLDNGFAQEIAGVKLGISGDQLALQNQTGAAIQANCETVAPGTTYLGNQEVLLCLPGGESYWIITGNAAEHFDDEYCYYLAAKETGEIKLIRENGLLLGRHHKWVSHVMVDKRIGREHGEITTTNGQAVFVDHSKNGSYVNGKLIHTMDQISGLPVPTRHILSSGDIIRLGSEEFEFRAIQLMNAETKNRAVYQAAVSAMENASSEEDYLSAAAQFQTIPAYSDAQLLYKKCIEKAQDCHNTAICKKASALGASMEIDDIEKAISMLTPIAGWKDVSDQIRRLEDHLKECKKIQKDYAQACAALEQAEAEEDCTKAEAMFRKLGSFRDCEQRVRDCQAKRSAIQKKREEKKTQLYEQAIRAFNSADYENAIKLLAMIPGWKKADLLAEAAREMLKHQHFSDRTVVTEVTGKGKADVGDTEEATIVGLEEGTISGLDEATISGVGDELTVRSVSSVSCAVVDPRPVIIDLAAGTVFNGNPDSTAVGRLQAQCDIAFAQNKRLSRKHFEIFTYNGKHHIRDCSSRNGTAVNGKKLQSAEAVVIDEQALVNVPGLSLLVVFGENAGYLRKHDNLGFMHSQSYERLMLLKESETILYVEDPDATIMAERTHLSVCGTVRMSAQGGIVSALVDGTVSVNERPVPAGTEAVIHDGDSVKVGIEAYTFHAVQLRSKS